MNPETNPENPDREAADIQSEVEHEIGVDKAQPKYDRFAPLRIRDYRLYLLGGIFAACGQQMTTFTVSWELYERTRSPFVLGILGLVMAFPVIFLALPAGTLADRAPRKRIVMLAELGAIVCLALLSLISRVQAPLPAYYAIILCNAICSAFVGPALGAMVANVVPPELIPSAAKFGSIRWQLAATIGPVLAGYLIHHWKVAYPIYAIDSIGRGLFFLCLWPIKPRPQEISKEKLDWGSVIAGWHFVRSNPLILSTISLDMVAVLFGGATALLPVYAKEVLLVGPDYLGPMKAAMAFGAVTMSILLTILPPFKKAGKTLLLAVAGFGAATVVFGLSTNYALSLCALFVLGALDNISVVIRHTLLQILTPDSMRGRVNAVNSVFIGTSNEIGELESGLAAGIFGPVIAVAGGGVITVAVVAWVAHNWPQVRRLGSLESVAYQEKAAEAA